jgi:Isochorismatase family
MQPSTRDNSAMSFSTCRTGSSKTAALYRLKSCAARQGRWRNLRPCINCPSFYRRFRQAAPFLHPCSRRFTILCRGCARATSAFADRGLVDALRSNGRQVLVLAGVASEIVVQRTALDALAAGLAPYLRGRWDHRIGSHICGGTRGGFYNRARRRYVGHRLRNAWRLNHERIFTRAGDDRGHGDAGPADSGGEFLDRYSAAAPCARR